MKTTHCRGYVERPLGQHMVLAHGRSGWVQSLHPANSTKRWNYAERPVDFSHPAPPTYAESHGVWVRCSCLNGLAG